MSFAAPQNPLRYNERSRAVRKQLNPQEAVLRVHHEDVPSLHLAAELEAHLQTNSVILFQNYIFFALEL